MGSKKKHTPKSADKPKGQQNGQSRHADNGPKTEKKGTASPPTSAQSKGQQRDKSSSCSKIWLLVAFLSVMTAGIAVVVVSPSAQSAFVMTYKTYGHEYMLQAAEYLSLDVSEFDEWIMGLASGDQPQGANSEDPSTLTQKALPTEPRQDVQKDDGQTKNVENGRSDSTQHSQTKSVETSSGTQQESSVQKDAGIHQSDGERHDQAKSAGDASSEKPIVQDIKVTTKHKTNTDSPSGSGDKPSGSSDKSSGSGDKPSGSGDKSLGSGDKSSVSGDKPSGSSDKSSGSSDKSSGNGDTSSGSGDRPSGSSDKSSGSGDKPSGNSDKLSSGGDKATDSLEKDVKPLKTPRDSYAKSSITNDDDYIIRKSLDEADSLLERGVLDEALKKYDTIIATHPASPRAHIGKADTLDKMAEKQRSNELLEQSIKMYSQLLTFAHVPDDLMKTAARRLADRQQFRGWGQQSAKTMQFLVDRFPDDIALQRELGVSYLMAGQNAEAKQVFSKILEGHRTDGFAMVHLGFIYQTSDNDPATAIPLLQAGIESDAPGTQDGRFYFHLGSALQRQGHMAEAHKLYERGANKGLFLSADQRSLYNVNTLTRRPWWTVEQTGYQRYIKLLEDNWQVIREEGLSQLNSETGDFRPEDENLREAGEWKQLTLYAQGRKRGKICAKVPKTCALIDQIEPANSCRRGQVKFSVMHPGVHVWPHCGPTNCRIRAHLGLVVPEGPRIRVVNETRTWQEGKFIFFDDSFEHEVWHDGKSVRMVLIVDFWHPELTESQRRSLTPI